MCFHPWKIYKGLPKAGWARTLYKAHDPNHPAGKEIAHVTLLEGSYDEFESACPPQTK
jgi:hypothetical protein